MSITLRFCVLLLCVLFCKSSARAPKRASLPSEKEWQELKFKKCCIYNDQIAPGCYRSQYNLCSFKTLNKDTMVNSFVHQTCPSTSHYPILFCASGFKDHTACCRRKLGDFNQGRCVDYCNPTQFIPKNSPEYVPCIERVEEIIDCFKNGL